MQIKYSMNDAKKMKLYMSYCGITVMIIRTTFNHQSNY